MAGWPAAAMSRAMSPAKWAIASGLPWCPTSMLSGCEPSGSTTSQNSERKPPKGSPSNRMTTFS